MLTEILLNPVFLAIVLLLTLSALRVNVVFSLIIASVAGGLFAGTDPAAMTSFGAGAAHCGKVLTDVLGAFEKGLGNGAQIAFSYAVLGAFSIAISRSGITELLAQTLFKKISGEVTPQKIFFFKYILLFILTLAAISSQNLIPVHIAFIPILIPPLLQVFERIRLDRRAVACILTFGLITPYMVLPFGFGQIYLNKILISNIADNGLAVTADMAPKAMFIPALGMIAGLLTAVFISYRKPRDYDAKKTELISSQTNMQFSPRKTITAVIAIAVALAGQFFLNSLVAASVAGIFVFVFAGVISIKDTQDVFTRGVYLMGGIGIVMIAASGFANVMRATGGVDAMVEAVASTIGDQRGLAVFLMLFIGLVITMGIGSSFSTVPLIAAIYVPLCIKLGISPLATVAVVGVAGALGDAGSPVSESVLGPTAGLNADGQHDHIYDSTLPTFLHFNIPLLIAGWIAGMIL